MNIGIFGGAFDPFHKEHKEIIVAAKNQLDLDKVIIVPSFSPPHKTGISSPYNCRRRMVESSVNKLDYVIIDDIEYQRNTSNPTNEILAILKEKYPCNNLYFIMGGDSMVKFHTWIKPEIICSIAILAVAKRVGYNDKIHTSIELAREKYKANIISLDYMGKDISSSEIKATIELGMDSQNISDEVKAIIKEEGLYKVYCDMVSKLKCNIYKDTFVHVSNSVLYGMRLNAAFNLPYRKVFLSCLLHDCAKHLHTYMEGVPPKVVHQFSGATLAKDIYGVIEDDILDAIRYHTTGKKEMSDLGRLVYCADMLEKDRDFDGVEELRTLIENDFDKGFVACVNKSINKLNKENNPIHPLTKECAAYYNELYK